MFDKIKRRKKYRILSIDGGGMKGIFTAYAIWKLEEDYNIKILDYFDMIIGTSTGALISAGLLSGLSGKKIYETYVDENNKIFAGKKSFTEQFKSTFYSAYHHEGLNSYLKNEIGDYTLEKLYEESKKDFAFFATNFTKAKPLVYSSPNLVNSELVKNNVSLLEALRTTTAAPFFFEPFKDEENDHLILDGGVWANNPSLVGLSLAITELKKKMKNIEILSFGQTFTDDLNFKIYKSTEVLKSPMKNQFVQLLLSVLALSQNSQTVLMKNLVRDKMYRYAPEVHQSGIAIDKVNTRFINYAKVYWNNNKESLIKFIKTGNNLKNLN